MIRRLVFATLATGLLLGSQVGSAGASLVWADDPPVLVFTPAGNMTAVYVTSYAGLFKSPCLTAENVSATSAPGKDPGTTKVDVAVAVPALCGRFPYTTDVTTGAFGSGNAYVTGSGVAGSTQHLYFTLNEP